MKKSLLLLGLASSFALTGCHGLFKCSYADYKAAGEKALETKRDVDTISWKGSWDGEKMEFTSKTSILDLSIKANFIRGILLAIDRVDASYVVENSNATYYKGFGFKVVDGDDKMEYDAKGYLAKVVAKEDGKVYSFSVSHTFVK